MLLALQVQAALNLKISHCININSIWRECSNICFYSKYQAITFQNKLSETEPIWGLPFGILKGWMSYEEKQMIKIKQSAFCCYGILWITFQLVMILFGWCMKTEIPKDNRGEYNALSKTIFYFLIQSAYGVHSGDIFKLFCRKLIRR